MHIYLASGNAHKVAELQTLAGAAHGIVIHSAKELGGMPPVDEDTGTFVGNARKKARALAALIPPGTWALADDSGVCVDHLGGAPGVESAYYAGPQGDAAANLAKLTQVMRGVPAAWRGASFVCVLLLIDPAGNEHVFEGRCVGRLLEEPRGGAGFGYDPLFLPDGHTRTFGEMTSDEKHGLPPRGKGLSHRARAFLMLAEACLAKR